MTATTANFEPGEAVFYRPSHAIDNFNLWERGTVSSKTDKTVFVRFAGETGQGCNPADLFHVDPKKVINNPVAYLADGIKWDRLKKCLNLTEVRDIVMIDNETGYTLAEVAYMAFTGNLELFTELGINRKITMLRKNLTGKFLDDQPDAWYTCINLSPFIFAAKNE